LLFKRGREPTLATWEEELYPLLFKRAREATPTLAIYKEELYPLLFKKEREATLAIGRGVSLFIHERKRSNSC
jgi:hypothetical protein